MKIKQKISFDEFYHDIYGDRWEALKAALLEEPEGFCLSTDMLKPYYLDRASAAAASALNAEAGDIVLDMCAAPGGKTLVLASALNGTGSLTSNDRSSERRRRLHDVIETHLPRVLMKNITVTGHDAAKWGLFEKNVYDRILLDAPCSSEEHVIKSKPHLAKWSPARTRQLSVQAHAMLAAAVDAAKPGGTIVYSTCALSPLENDGVIAKLLKKRSDRISVDLILPEADFLNGLHAESTQYGIQIMPDKNNGWGPIYMTRLIKNLNI